MASDSYRLLIFDWDGTLMNSIEEILYCMGRAIEDLQLEPKSRSEIKDIIGLGLHEAVEALYPGREPGFAQTMADCYRHHYLSGQASAANLFEGVEPLLHGLRDEGYQLAVATGKGRIGLDKVLRETGLGPIFHATRCSDETRSKPHPLMLEELMGELGGSPEETLMIGDSEFDLEMANRAGIGSVAVGHGVHSCERLRQHAPLECLDQVADLHDWLRGSYRKTA